MTFKKYWPLAISLLSLSCTLQASDAQMRNLENRVTALEQRRGANGMINPSGRPHVRDGIDVFVTGDLLLWNAHENGLALAIKNDDPDDSTPASEAKVVNPDFDWSWGFRAGLGYNLPHDGWDLYLNWTYFYNRAHTTREAHDDEELFTTWSPPINDIGAVAKMKSHWKLQLNMLDLEMGREFFVSKFLTLRPFMGLRTAWIRQKNELHYKTGLNSSRFDLPPNSVEEIGMRSKYWGLGVRSGFNTLWGLGAGFSIYGDASISLLYGLFTNKFEDEVAERQVYDIDTDHFRVSRAITDLALGVRWDRNFCDDCFHLGIKAGWEHHYFFGMNTFSHFTDDVVPGTFVNNNGDLTLQGWTLAVRMDF